jgi:benzaldehyde dehydrogenase (NAD)
MDPGAWSGKVFTGEWRSTGNTAKSVEPATGDVLAEVGMATAEDLSTSARAAADAGREWAARPYQERTDVLRRAAQLLEDNRQPVGEWIAREAGKVAAARSLELQLSIDELWQAAALTAAPLGALLPSTDPDRQSIARRHPHGVVAVIAPWNFPLNLAMRSVAPALACGNAVVLKPASETVVCCGVVIARLFEQAGLPAGVLHMLPGKGSELGTAFADDPNIDMISFTGSTEVGKSLSEAAGRNVKKFVAELGGNNPFLILDDVDVSAAAQAAAFGCFTHQGQICMATGRVLVAESIAEQFVGELASAADALSVGNPLDDVDLGPIINDSQATHIDEIVRRSLDAGAQLRAGGTRDGLFFRPTVIAGVSPQMAAYTEEIFGPVAAVTTFKADEEAISLANDTPYGLVAGVHSGSVQRAKGVGEQLRAGMVHINDQTVNDEVVAPFGGQGDSGGDGRFGAFTNLDEFTTWKWVTIRETQSTPQ